MKEEKILAEEELDQVTGGINSDTSNIICCTRCGSENIERLSGAGWYFRCHDCGARFSVDDGPVCL